MPGGNRLSEAAVETYGVRLLLAASDQRLLAKLMQLPPPGSTPCPPSEAERFSLIEEPGLGYRVGGPGALNMVSAELELALGVLHTAVELHVAAHADGFVFVHAGVVAHDGRAIVLPGPSLSGKTTLVRALVEAGAVYYSDEWAVLDQDGVVHPYPRPLGIRGEDQISVGHTPHDLGFETGQSPAPIAVIARTSYRPGARWEPKPATPGRGILVLLEGTLAARDRPAPAMAAARRAAADAQVLEGERGEALETAQALLAFTEASVRIAR